MRRVLLTGATGFVGSRLEPRLRALGLEVLCGTRRPEDARRRWPERMWCRMDLGEPSSIERALEGCDGAFFLVHEIASGRDYPAREARNAHAFATAAQRLERVIYLGGPQPSGPASRHLQSRVETGRILREEGPPSIELRAGMIIGRGSASWQMVRDLSARLPAMVLPAWTQFRSSPVAIDDVLAALCLALELPIATSAWLDVPGPETITHEALLRRVASHMGKRPWMLPVPLLTPSLSSYWVALVTSVGLPMARELVAGLQADLVPRGTSVWSLVPAHPLVSLDDAIERALEQEHPSLERSVAARTGPA